MWEHIQSCFVLFVAVSLLDLTISDMLAVLWKILGLHPAKLALMDGSDLPQRRM